MRKIIAIAFAGVLLLGVLVAAPASGLAASAAEADAAARAAARSLRLQMDLPEDSDIREQNKRPSLPDPSVSSFSLSANTALILFWLAAAVAIAVVLMTLHDNLWSSSHARNLHRVRDEGGAAASVAARMDMAQDEADDLALRGSFAEAMHALLLHSVNEVRRRLDITIAASLTSREILSKVALPVEGRAALGDIIGRVEISHFGTHEPGEAEYLACRQSFEQLAAALRREGSA